MVEHRLDRRVEIRIPVRLCFQDGTLGWGLATDIGREGIFVKTSARSRHPGNGCVDVSMTVATPGGERRVLLPAAVIHASARGFGAMFLALDLPAKEVVFWLLAMGHPSARVAARPAPAAGAGAAPPPDPGRRGRGSTSAPGWRSRNATAGPSPDAASPWPPAP
jgi:hypothetical protein